MKCLGFLLALLAAIAMTIVPSPVAAQPTSKKAGYEMRERATMLTAMQLEQLKSVRPKLYAKLTAAHKMGARPRVSASEAQYLHAISK